MKVVFVKMKNIHGLHVRPTKRLVEISRTTDEKIVVKNVRGKQAEGTDFFGLISLEISVGEDIMVSGPDNQVDEICEFLKEFSVE